MALFDPDKKRQSARHKEIYAACELAHTVVDFAAAILFLAGSIMFFWQGLETPAIWCFVIGSACFAAKPTIRMLREFAYLRVGDFDTLAEREERG